MHFFINFATRERPKRFMEAMQSIIEQSSGQNPLTILCIFDYNDTASNELTGIDNDSFKGLFAGMISEKPITINRSIGRSQNKINAINRQCENILTVDFDVLVNFSDDMRFIVPNWDQTIESEINRIGSTDCFLHFPDSNHQQADALSTLHIVGKDYFNRDKYIYHPSYVSVWCDNEAQDIAKQRKCYHFIKGQYIFDHLHPAYGKATQDALSKRTESKEVHLADRKNYEKRKKLCFPK